MKEDCKKGHVRAPRQSTRRQRTFSGKKRAYAKKEVAKVYGGKKVDDVWMRRTNEELSELYGEPSITNVVRASRMRWLGHVSRLDASRPTNQVLTKGITGRRRRGRPRTEWLQAVEADLKKIEIKDWHKRTGNRKEWRTICNQAMGLLGS
ncbi:hypothetical protein MML48_7g00007798 [Holotrichia oblita]|uniref:Uncharacterized protein n=1 Tax=Holotrichia oblita TaxID=644536 RepID=A0ACB9SRQ9_HOLOL|nr:hypothetical protein MML48_7g00007798 [Holotrichia oblita]